MFHSVLQNVAVDYGSDSIVHDFKQRLCRAATSLDIALPVNLSALLSQLKEKL